MKEKSFAWKLLIFFFSKDQGSTQLLLQTCEDLQLKKGYNKANLTI